MSAVLATAVFLGTVAGWQSGGLVVNRTTIVALGGVAVFHVRMPT